MIVYLCNTLVILLLQLMTLLLANKKARKAVLLFGAFLFMFYLSFSRIDIGYDYKMYTEGFYRMARDGFDTLAYLDWEIGFVLFTKLIARFTLDHHVYLGVISASCLLSVAVFIYRNSKIPWISVLLYANMFFFFMSMNFLRQAMALSIVLIAWEFMKKRWFWAFATMILIAASFHKTALIMLPIYFFVKLYPSKKLILLYGYIGLFFYISSQGIVNLIMELFSSDYQGSVFLTGASLWYAVFPIALLITALVFQKELMQLEIKNKYYIHFMYMSAFLMLIMTKFVILERFSYYTNIFTLILVPELVLAIQSRYIASVRKKYDITDDSLRMEKAILWGSSLRIRFIMYGIIIVAAVGYCIFGLLNGVHGVTPYQMDVEYLQQILPQWLQQWLQQFLPGGGAG